MVKEASSRRGQLGAKADGFYEAAKDLEAVITDGVKTGWTSRAPTRAREEPVGELTNQVFGTDGKTGIANDAKSSLSDAATRSTN